MRYLTNNIRCHGKRERVEKILMNEVNATTKHSPLRTLRRDSLVNFASVDCFFVRVCVVAVAVVVVLVVSL